MVLVLVLVLVYYRVLFPATYIRCLYAYASMDVIHAWMRVRGCMNAYIYTWAGWIDVYNGVRAFAVIITIIIEKNSRVETWMI